MVRQFHEPYEPEDIFDRAEAQERRARIDAARADHEVMARHEAEQEAVRKESAHLNSLRANDMLLRHEYERAGVEPLKTNGSGVPTVSLSLLRSMGWTIEQVGERNMLIAPAERQTKPGKQRQDYDQSS